MIYGISHQAWTPVYNVHVSDGVETGVGVGKRFVVYYWLVR